MTPEELFASSNGMEFIFKDYDEVGSSTVLGRVVAPHSELLEGIGERMEYDIVLENEFTTSRRQMSKYGKTPKLYLRFKEADEKEIKV
jgi:hypothetical protein